MKEFIAEFNYDTFLQLAIIVLGTIVVAQVVVFLLGFIAKKITKNTKTDTDDLIIKSIKGPLFYTILLVGIYLALCIMFFGEVMKAFTLPFFQTTLIIIWTIFCSRLIKIIFQHFAQIKRARFITQQTLPLFINMSLVILWSVAIYVSFSVWGINMTAWLASAGVAGIAIGFAAKDTLANFISGIFILTDAPYKIGDWIVLDSGERGKVTNIGIRTTRIVNVDDMEVTVPNAVIGNATLINESGGSAGRIYRVRTPFSVAYGTDIDKAEKVVYEIAKNNEHVLDEPEPRVRFRTFGASSLDFELLFWVEDSAKKGRAKHEINHAIYKAFMRNNIEIPYAKQDVYIKEFPSESSK